MKASDLTKVSISIEAIYTDITNANTQGRFKHFIPSYIYVSDEVKDQLKEDGFKVNVDDWDGVIRDCLIIEW